MTEERQSIEERKNLIYRLDGRPPLPVAFPLGLQHVLAMFTSNLAPCFILAGVVGMQVVYTRLPDNESQLKISKSSQ